MDKVTMIIWEVFFMIPIQIIFFLAEKYVNHAISLANHNSPQNTGTEENTMTYDTTDLIFALYTKCHEELATISEKLDANYLDIKLKDANNGQVDELIEIGNRLEEIITFMR